MLLAIPLPATVRLGDGLVFYNVKVGYEAQKNKNDEGNKQKFIRITSAGTATNYST